MKDYIDTEFDVVGEPPPPQMRVSRGGLITVRLVMLATGLGLAFGAVEPTFDNSTRLGMAIFGVLTAWCAWPLARAIESLGERASAQEVADLRQRSRPARRAAASRAADGAASAERASLREG